MKGSTLFIIILLLVCMSCGELKSARKKEEVKKKEKEAPTAEIVVREVAASNHTKAHVKEGVKKRAKTEAKVEIKAGAEDKRIAKAIEEERADVRDETDGSGSGEAKEEAKAGNVIGNARANEVTAEAQEIVKAAEKLNDEEVTAQAKEIVKAAVEEVAKQKEGGKEGQKEPAKEETKEADGEPVKKWEKEAARELAKEEKKENEKINEEGKMEHSLTADTKYGNHGKELSHTFPGDLRPKLIYPDDCTTRNLTAFINRGDQCYVSENGRGPDINVLLWGFDKQVTKIPHDIGKAEECKKVIESLNDNCRKLTMDSKSRWNIASHPFNRTHV